MAKSSSIAAVKIDQEVNQNFLSSVDQLRKSRENVLAKEENFSLLLGGDASAKIGLYGDIEAIARSTGHSSVENRIIDPALRAQRKPSINNESDGTVLIKPYSSEALIVEISLVGTYNNFIDFLHKIEHFEYLADIQNISVKAVIENERDQRLRTTSQKENDEDKDPRKNLVESTVEIAVYLDTLIDQVGIDKEGVDAMQLDSELVDEDEMLDDEMPSNQ